MSVMKALQNYRNLVEKVDGLCRIICERYHDRIACRKGCDGCCRHISLCRVEAVNIALALRQLPGDEILRIRAKALASSRDGSCPLLEDGACLLYPARPVICRTHGLPILTREFGQPSVDFCPENFIGIEKLPGNAVIDIDLLNTSLAAIDALFVADFFKGRLPEKERLTVAEALLLEVPFFGR